MANLNRSFNFKIPASGLAQLPELPVGPDDVVIIGPDPSNANNIQVGKSEGAAQFGPYLLFTPTATPEQVAVVRNLSELFVFGTATQKLQINIRAFINSQEPKTPLAAAMSGGSGPGSGSSGAGASGGGGSAPPAAPGGGGGSGFGGLQG